MPKTKTEVVTGEKTKASTHIEEVSMNKVDIGKKKHIDIWLTPELCRRMGSGSVTDTKEP